MKSRVRVLLVDDHEVVRDGVKSLINANDDLTVAAEAGSVREAIDQAVRTKPDVVVMDVRLADGSGIEATREIRARLENTQVLMLTSYADDDALFASIMAGASGYVLKQIRGGELIRAIREVGAGKSLLDPEVTRSVLERLRKGKMLRDEKLARKDLATAEHSDEDWYANLLGSSIRNACFSPILGPCFRLRPHLGRAPGVLSSPRRRSAYADAHAERWIGSAQLDRRRRSGSVPAPVRRRELVSGRRSGGASRFRAAFVAGEFRRAGRAHCQSVAIRSVSIRFC
ncbi:MAG TPA: response regulator transcription factor [Candidatus Dormibacteraeota bacterium]